jgi:hypothetical protein
VCVLHPLTKDLLAKQCNNKQCGVNSSMVYLTYCRNFCNCHVVCPTQHSKQNKQRKRKLKETKTQQCLQRFSCWCQKEAILPQGRELPVPVPSSAVPYCPLAIRHCICTAFSPSPHCSANTAHGHISSLMWPWVCSLGRGLFSRLLTCHVLLPTIFSEMPSPAYLTSPPTSS